MLRFAGARMPAEEFEEWLYNEPTVEAALGADHYLELISVDFRNQRAVAVARDAVAGILEQHHSGLLGRERVRVLLREMLDGTCPLVVGLRRMSVWYSHGDDFIPEIFSGYESETDTVPEPSQYSLWESEALARQLERLTWYEKDIRDACREFLGRLDADAEQDQAFEAQKDPCK